MKLKYYLRGMGIGIILTAIVMGFALGGRKKTISDAEVIERAKALGMVEATAGTLSQFAGENEQEDGSNEAASDSSLDQTGAEISEKIDQGVASSDQSVSDLFEKTPPSETAQTENEGSSKQNTQEDQGLVATADNGKEESAVNGATKNLDENVIETKPAETSDNKEEKKEEEKKEEKKEEEKKEEQPAETENQEETEVTENDTPVSTGGFRTSTEKTINIPGGLSSDSVAAILYKEGLVDNATNFNRYLIERNMDRYIRSGTKTIPAGSDYEQIAKIICRS